MRRRHAEDRQHRVTGELLDRAPVALECPPHLVEVRQRQAADALRIHSLAHFGRSGHVAEEQRRELAPLGGRCPERAAAAVAEPGSLGIPGAARRAHRHVASLTERGDCFHGRAEVIYGTGSIPGLSVTERGGSGGWRRAGGVARCPGARGTHVRAGAGALRGPRDGHARGERSGTASPGPPR